MNKSSPQIKLACLASLARTEATEDGGDPKALTPTSVFQLPPEDAAEYIAEVLTSLRAIAVKAQLDILSDLIEVAGEEARLHSRL